MNPFFYLSLAALVLLFAGSADAHFTRKGHVHTVAEAKEVFLNPDCRSTATCDLKRFTLTTSAYEVWFSDDPDYPTYGNGAIIEYETDSVAALENYAVVQFKKGCVFYSSQDRNGKIHRHVADTTASFGETVPFCFSQWVIDSQDTDPAYNSDPEYGRFHLLRWNKPGSYDHRSHKYYGAEKPKMPVLYMTDHPAGAFVTGTAVKNVSLEFKTCIYKASDVPAQTRRNDIAFAKAITCFPWQNIYIYDFALGSFRTDPAYAPTWPESAPVINLLVLAIFTLLFIAAALITVPQLRKFQTQIITPDG